ncbi:MAG: type II toxin-antitoxin system VapC family toxin [Patescibacteria group bacterium]|jgi:PIN domain nuclease of toxin-antitoxin system
MNILLDTHILIWSLANTKKLRPYEQTLLLSPHINIFVSVVSLWEISLKYSLGKLALHELDLPSLLNDVNTSNYTIITISPNEAVDFHKLSPSLNTDPFDRMLCWQAICNNYYFMSRDQKIKQYQGFGLKLVTKKLVL